MSLNDKILKKATGMQSKMASQLPNQIREAFMKDIATWEKEKGCKPTVEEMIQPFKENKMFMLGMEFTLGLKMEDMERMAQECLDG